MKRIILIGFMVLAMAVTAFAGDEYGVYVKAVNGAKPDFAGVVKQVEDAATAAGWTVLASFDTGVEDRCGKVQAHVVVVNNDEYASKLMKHGPLAAFALPVRIGVFEDASGIHVDFVNPASIVRTVLGDGVEDELAVQTMKDLAKSLGDGVQGNAAVKQIGQLRDEGHVGGMGGGDFVKKVETIHTGGAVDDVVSKVQEGIKADTNGWKLIYTLKAGDATIIGLTKKATEAKAFDIAGEKRETDKDQCPGLDHAAAFPIEVVVSGDAGKAKVQVLDEMYRMKVYFEDAGNWAFMKNMTMPGHIEDEVVAAATAKLK